MYSKLLKLFIFTTFFLIIQVSYAQEVTTFTGTAGVIGSIDGDLARATFYRPHDLAFDTNGNLFVADRFNHTIRKITPDGMVTTFAGSAGIKGSRDGTGINARFNEPVGLTFDTNGDLFVADYLNHTIRKITPDGVVTTFAGTAGVIGGKDGTGTTARFYRPLSLAFDTNGNLFVSEYFNHIIRKITPTGIVTTFVGSAGVEGFANDTGSRARFNRPFGLAFDTNGDLFVAEYSNHTIRKITPAGVVTIFAGTVGIIGSTNAKGTAAKFNTPVGLVFDANNNLFVADYLNHTIRKINPAGEVTIFAGSTKITGSTDGRGTAAKFHRPVGFTFDTNGDLFVADYLNHTIRKITMEKDTVIITPTDTTDVPFDTVDVVDFSIPNIFTPNGDGFNDSFGIPEVIFQDNPTLCENSLFKMVIYNRWGRLIYQGDCNNPHWDGGNFPSGVYFYEIAFQKDVFKGNFSLFRDD